MCRNVHSDIQMSVNGWFEQRCPLAYLGCSYSQRRFQPSTHEATISYKWEKSQSSSKCKQRVKCEPGSCNRAMISSTGKESTFAMTPSKNWFKCCGGNLRELCITERPQTSMTQYCKQEWAKIPAQWYQSLIKSCRKWLLHVIAAKNASESELLNRGACRFVFPHFSLCQSESCKSATTICNHLRAAETHYQTD